MTGITCYEMLFLEEERGNHFTILTNPAISDVRSAKKLANFARAKHRDDR